MDSYTFYTIILNLCIKAYFIKVSYLSLHPPVLSLFTHMLIDTANSELAFHLFILVCFFLLSEFVHRYAHNLHCSFEVLFYFYYFKNFNRFKFQNIQKGMRVKNLSPIVPQSPNSCLWRPTILSVSLSFQSVLYSIYLGGGKKN